MGIGGQGNRLHLISRGAFEIKRDAKARLKCGYVTVANVATVFAQVGCDAIRTGHLGQKGGAQRIGPSTAARVAHGGHMVDVHPKAQLSKIFHSSHPNSLDYYLDGFTCSGKSG